MSAISTSAWPRLVGNIRRTVTTLVTGSYADSYGAVILKRCARLLPDRFFPPGPLNGRLLDDHRHVGQRDRVVVFHHADVTVQADGVSEDLAVTLPGTRSADRDVVLGGQHGSVDADVAATTHRDDLAAQPELLGADLGGAAGWQAGLGREVP